MPEESKGGEGANGAGGELSSLSTMLGPPDAGLQRCRALGVDKVAARELCKALPGDVAGDVIELIGALKPRRRAREGGEGAVVASPHPTVLLDAVEKALESAGVVVRTMDKKRERAALFSLRQSLQADLKATSDPALTLVLTGQLLHLRTFQSAIPGAPLGPHGGGAGGGASGGGAGDAVEVATALVRPLLNEGGAALNEEDREAVGAFQGKLLALHADPAEGGECTELAADIEGRIEAIRELALRKDSKKA